MATMMADLTASAAPIDGLSKSIGDKVAQDQQVERLKSLMAEPSHTRGTSPAASTRSGASTCDPETASGTTSSPAHSVTSGLDIGRLRVARGSGPPKRIQVLMTDADSGAELKLEVLTGPIGMPILSEVRLALAERLSLSDEASREVCFLIRSGTMFAKQVDSDRIPRALGRGAKAVARVLVRGVDLTATPA